MIHIYIRKGRGNILKSFKEIYEKIGKWENKRTIAVAAAADNEVLEAVLSAREKNLANFILVGNEALIKKIAGEIGLDLNEITIINELNDAHAAKRAVKCVKTGKAEILMKGFLSTSDFLRAVLEKEYGLRTQSILSHIALFEVPVLQRLLIVTDSAMNIAPALKEKVKLINNAVTVASALEIKEPKVAAVCAVEVVNPDMPATIDAALLTVMAARGQIKNALVEGPLGLDNAISEEAARHKGIKSPVAGRADIILVPEIETGNVMYKTLSFLSESPNAGIIVGAAAPVVLTSRADSSVSKLNSIALSILMAQ